MPFLAILKHLTLLPLRRAFFKALYLTVFRASLEKVMAIFSAISLIVLVQGLQNLNSAIILNVQAVKAAANFTKQSISMEAIIIVYRFRLK